MRGKGRKQKKMKRSSETNAPPSEISVPRVVKGANNPGGYLRFNIDPLPPVEMPEE